MTQRMRREVEELVALGRFPDARQVEPNIIERQQALLDAVAPPVTDAEARELVRLFGNDDYFGLAWTLLHLIESAPSWPLMECLICPSNEWIRRLVERANRRLQ